MAHGYIERNCIALLLDHMAQRLPKRTKPLGSQGVKDLAMQLLGEALALAEPGAFIRLFVDEGPPM